MDKKFILAFVILLNIVLLSFIVAMNPVVKIWTINGTFHYVADSYSLGFVTDNIDPMTTIVVPLNEPVHNLRARYPLGPAKENELVFMFRVYAKVKPNKEGVYTTWIVPTKRFNNIKSIDWSISNHSGQFGLVADDSGQTDNVGYVREYTSDNPNGTHYTLPLDNMIPYYKTIVLNKDPHVGDQVKFTVFRIHTVGDSETWWILSIIY